MNEYDGCDKDKAEQSEGGNLDNVEAIGAAGFFSGSRFRIKIDVHGVKPVSVAEIF